MNGSTDGQISCSMAYFAVSSLMVNCAGQVTIYRYTKNGSPEVEDNSPSIGASVSHSVTSNSLWETILAIGAFSEQHRVIYACVVTHGNGVYSDTNTAVAGRSVEWVDPALAITAFSINHLKKNKKKNISALNFRTAHLLVSVFDSVL